MTEHRERRGRRPATGAPPAHAARARAGVALVLAAALLASEGRAFAQAAPKAHAQAVSTEAQNAARSHYQRARELYQAGSYREAITELEAALALDPGGKDLVFNLGLVNEKLGNIDEALRYLRRYADMDLEPQERARAEGFIKRLEGAKREVKADEKPAAPVPPEPRETAQAHGRVDVLTLSAAVIGIAGIAVGTVFGVKAMNDNPPGDGHYASYSDYLAQQNDAEAAHREAKVADVAFIVGGVALAATAALFFLRTKNTKTRQSIGVSPVPLASGAGAFVRGSF